MNSFDDVWNDVEAAVDRDPLRVDHDGSRERELGRGE